jgi:hypothetical protein
LGHEAVAKSPALKFLPKLHRQRRQIRQPWEKLVHQSQQIVVCRAKGLFLQVAMSLGRGMHDYSFTGKNLIFLGKK